MPRPVSDCWNALAVPWKLPVMDSGSNDDTRALQFVDRLSDGDARPRSKDNVTDESWPVWLTVSGPKFVTNLETALSGTTLPEAERM